MSPSCTRVSCRANLLGNTTQSTQELTVVFSVDPNCQQSADVFFALRDGNGLSLSNQSFVDCFSILQQDRLEVTLGPLPEDVEAVTFSLNQETNETTVLTLTVQINYHCMYCMSGGLDTKIDRSWIDEWMDRSWLILTQSQHDY